MKKKYVFLVLLISWIIITLLWKDVLLEKEEEQVVTVMKFDSNIKVEEAPVKESKASWYYSLKEEITGIIVLLNTVLIVLERIKKLRG
jgi:hypothetical protein